MMRSLLSEEMAQNMTKKMTKDEVLHLAGLARITLTDIEAEKLTGEFDEILSYVSEVEEIAAQEGEKKVGVHYNVLREDGKPHEGGMYTEALLDAAPERDGQYLKVKKILGES